jgi:hypothetical protein
MAGMLQSHLEREAQAEAERLAAEAAKRDCGPFGVGCMASDAWNAGVGLASSAVSAGQAFVANPVGFVQENASAIAHTALMVASFAPPPINVAAALLDAGLYAFEGDYMSAAMSLMGAIPGGRLAAMGGGALLKGASKGLSLATKAGKAGLTKLKTLGGKVLGKLGKAGDELVEAGEKKVPNPWGKAGGPAHQAKVSEVIEEMESRGLTVKQEVPFAAGAGGPQKTRYADVVGFHPDGAMEVVQVGRQTVGGMPVIRERRALNDILESADLPGGSIVSFLPYN